MEKKVLLFSDFGVDDFVAAIYAYFSEEIQIVGVVADYGNVSREDAIRNAGFLKELTGIKDIPVLGGAELPLTGEQPKYYPEVHGLEGLGPIIPQTKVDGVFENFDEIKNLINKYENELIIVNVGRLSSLATAFILYPSLMKKIKDFYIMGGAFKVPGNVTPMAEANFYGDPYAANIVINLSPKPVYIIPLDVTNSAIVTPVMINELHTYYQLTNDKVGLIIKPMVDYYFKFYQKTNPAISGSPLHDLLTFWAVRDEAEIMYTEVPVCIAVTKDCTYGQSAADFRKTNGKVNWKKHHVALKFNYSKFIQSFYKTMKYQNGKSS
ncbi:MULTISPECIES: nucleoside hydrolase [unclassified Bacillus (in: firmicutes)]|uniref:nucleoside hydrolase n=1 Tax=unclassified Bacillus (in: firmicutes) TaxID=185979 RepID=UPI0008E80BE8|nr:MULTISPECIES: nucleoside hydrolase [unclassified Bacillus (in: firmicutes)]SFA92250.1 purine nucleosidase [Bacillus sp. UNCCL13]SFQ85855.1 purine nucleosidase [Bacillus sp. cl95]